MQRDITVNEVRTIGVADDHPLMLRGLVDFIGDFPNFKVVGQASDASGVIELIHADRPSVLLMDLSMPGDVIGAIRHIAAEYPETRIVIITAFSSIDSAVKALDAGAMGFVLKGSPPTELIEAIEAVCAGQIYVARQYATQVLMGMREKDRTRQMRETVRLNIREKQIVGQLMHARTNREIADTLQLSEKTVKHYMTNLMVKLNARNRVEVVLAAQQSMDA